MTRRRNPSLRWTIKGALAGTRCAQTRAGSARVRYHRQSLVRAEINAAMTHLARAEFALLRAKRLAARGSSASRAAA